MTETRKPPTLHERYGASVPYRAINADNNMGVVRYLLAFVVLVCHYFGLVAPDEMPPMPITSYEAVGGFFALSGFLMFHSYLRSRSFTDYLRRRARRIIPPYFTVVIGAALGCVAVSTLTPTAYFSSSGFWAYLGANLTFLNFLHPTLPGVFEHNLLPAVNGSLWTVKEEWLLYLSVPALVWGLRHVRLRPLWWIVLIYLLSAGYRYLLIWLFEVTGREIYDILERQFIGQLMYFYVGVGVYFLYDKFRCHWWQVLMASALLVVMSIEFRGLHVLLYPAAVSLITLVLSLCLPVIGRVASIPNISYELYLFHFPVVQLVEQSGIPERWGVWWGFAVALTCSVAVSALCHEYISRRYYTPPRVKRI